MELILQRTRLRDDYTTGQLYIDGEYFCFTLEDKVREENGVPVEKWKVKGETAIPQGFYELGVEHSPRFGSGTITIKRVPGFDFIRIHTGNSSKDTEGCILVGYKVSGDHGLIIPGTTRPALNDLKKKLVLPANIRILNPQ